MAPREDAPADTDNAMAKRRVVTSGAIVQPEHKFDNEELGEVGGRVIFEDERVRVWDTVLEGGGYFGLHLHEFDYLVICLEAGRVKTQQRQDDGSWKEFHFDFHKGDVIPVYVNGGQLHRLFSLDDRRFVSRMVEFKAAPLDPPPRPVQYAVE